MGDYAVEPRYTLAEAWELLVRDRCMKGRGAPGHDVQTFEQRNGRDELCVWQLSCKRCGCVFKPEWPERP